MQSSRYLVNSYGLLLIDFKVSFVFMDNINNLFVGYIVSKLTKRLGKYKENVLTSVSIADDGIAKRDILYDFNKKGEKDFRIYDYNLDVHSILMLIYKGKKVFNLALIH
jgi:hypothetical protein